MSTFATFQVRVDGVMFAFTALAVTERARPIRIWIVVYYCFITPALSVYHTPQHEPPQALPPSLAPPPPPPPPFTLSLLSIPFFRHSATVLAWFDLAWLQKICTRKGEPTLRCFCLHTLFADIVCTDYCL